MTTGPTHPRVVDAETTSTSSARVRSTHARVVDAEARDEPPADGPDIPDKDWSVPFSDGTWLYELFTDVLEERRDVVILIDDYYGRRGTGKTVASLTLANQLDQNDEGLTRDKCSLEPEEIRESYTEEATRSGLVLDEGEVGASNRNPMSKTNQALREIMSMGRVEQKFVIINTPIRSFIDKDLQKLADVWISMVRKGLGLVHHLRWEPYSQQLLTPAKQWLEFDDIETGTPLRRVYNELTKDKRARMRGEKGDGFIPREEHQERLEKVKEQVHSETRNEVIRKMMMHDEINDAVSQRMVAEAVDISQSHVSNIT
jgi:hypothetical protein